jgi:hypothetical protein
VAARKSSKPNTVPKSGPEIPPAVPVEKETVWIVEYNNRESPTTYYECWTVAKTEDGAKAAKEYYEARCGTFGTVRYRQVALVDGSEGVFSPLSVVG